MKKFILNFFLSFLILFSAWFPLLSEAEDEEKEILHLYPSDRIDLYSDLSEDFSKYFLEYADGYVILLHGYLSELKKLDTKPKITLRIYSSCTDYRAYLLKKEIPIKKIIFFEMTESESWEKFEISGCYSNEKFFFRSFQHRLTESFLNDPARRLPFWFHQGFVEYIENTWFLADDYTILPIKNDNYLRRMYSLKKALKKKKIIEPLFLSSEGKWKQKPLLNYPMNWLVFTYLFDVHPEGRKILRRFFLNSDETTREDPAKPFHEVFDFLKSSEPYSLKDLEENFHSYLSSLEPVKGYEFYKSYKNSNVPSTKIKFLEEAIQANPHSTLYPYSMAKEYFEIQEFQKSLDLAERVISLEIRHKQALDLAIHASFEVQNFSKLEYYLYLGYEMGLDKEKYKPIEEELLEFLRNTPDSPKFKPPVAFLSYY